MERREIIEAILASKINNHLTFQENYNVGYLIARNKNNEGIFLIWNNKDKSQLTQEIYYQIAQEVKQHNLSSKKYHIYAFLSSFSLDNIAFEKIPDKILQDLGIE